MGKVNRRTFMEGVIASNEANKTLDTKDYTYEKYANKTMPKGLQKSTSSLTPYSGPWTEAEVIHLLRRTTFGVKYADVQTLSSMSMTQAVDQLLNISTAVPTPPLNN